MLPRHGIVLEEGENISGTYEWHEDIPMSIVHTYTFRPASIQSLGLLEMDFELIDGDVYNELVVELVIADASRRAISGGILFERRRREYVTPTRRKLSIDPYTAYSFGFLGGGFLNPGREDDLFEDSPWPFGLP